MEPGYPPETLALALFNLGHAYTKGDFAMSHEESKLCCGSKTGPSERKWPLPVPPAPPGTQRYNLRGPQIEPEAGFWTISPCPVPCVIRIEDLIKITDNRRSECYFPPYPTNSNILNDEIAELIELASLRDDPEALANPMPGNPQPSSSVQNVFPLPGNRRRLAISPFLQMRPQPLGAVFNRERREDEPVILTGRELARYFESETPGLAHRHALNFLISSTNWSPPRQALVWMALDVAIYSALLAAWYYKWYTDRTDVRYRPRPVEYDYRVSVLFNRQVNATQSGDGERRLMPDPSPGTPRHPAYPSGHSTYAGAASEMLSFFFPDYTAEFDKLADNAGMARLWAGIHWRSDHEQGMRLGRCVARQIINQLQRGCICPPNVCSTPPPCAAPPSHDDLERCARDFRACCRRKAEAGEHAAEASVTEGEEGTRPEEKEGGAVSSAAAREQAQGPQEGAPTSGSSAAERGQAQGPQEGGGSGAGEEAAREQAKGPQEGGK
jgi:PAP2 superfamily